MKAADLVSITVGFAALTLVLLKLLPTLLTLGELKTVL